MKPFVRSFVAVLFLTIADAAAAAPTFSASAATSWEGNLTRCPDPAAVKNAVVYDLEGTAEWHEQLSRDYSLESGAYAGFESCPRFDGLDHVQAGVQWTGRQKFGLGPYAPSLRAEISYTGNWYRESLHNGTRFSAGLSLSKRWTESWQSVLAAEYLANDGHAAAYDYHHTGVSGEIRCDLTERWQLTGGLRRQWGEQVTYAWLGGSGASFPYVFGIWKNTTASPTFGRNWYAYTIDAHADTVWISLSPTIGKDRALPLRLEQTAVVGRGESYRCRLISLSFLQRF